MDNIKKPPLGAKPAKFAAQERIRELAEAIDRSASDEAFDAKLVRTWAREIMMQCDICKEFQHIEFLDKPQE